MNINFLRLGMAAAIATTLLSPIHVDAAVKLPPFVSDRMVLQRDTELKLWGEADPGEIISVKFRDGLYETVTGDDGRWNVTLPPQSYGGPFILTVNDKVIRDVLVGDVWLCSGQSNQETPIARLVEKFPEIEVSNNHMIRHFKVPTQKSPEGVRESIPEGATWHSATASEVLNWTALAYFFANEAYDAYKVPVGMLVSSLGGSAIEGWISQEHLKEFPGFIADRAALDSLHIVSADRGAGKWHLPAIDDSNWPVMEMPGTWRENGLDVKGTVWMRKNVTVSDKMAGRTATLYMGTLVDADEVFVNGISVGSTAYQYPPRKYTIPAGVLRKGENVVAVRLTANYGNGEFVKDKRYAIVGIQGEEIPLSGEWRYNVGKDSELESAMRERLADLDKKGSGLYNGMIYPLRDYKVKGVIWYQGESNASYPTSYKSHLTSLIRNWRELSGRPDLPFLMVQLPNFMQKQDRPSDSGWARIREAQFLTSKEIPNTALAVTYDSGEWNDIHPLDKKTVAHRLMLGARKLIFGEKIQASGPVYESMTVKNGKVFVRFSQTGKGLSSGGEKLRHFAIAGADGKFVWADAVIKGDMVVVSSPQVPEPVAVRYAWSDNPEDANLRNRDGLLASPFRTDDW